MEKAKELIEELGTLMSKMDAQSEKRRSEIAGWFRENNTPENDALLDEFLDSGLANIQTEIDDIRHRIADEDYRLLPISYIARKYFGKSQAWLSQRINGTKVRGRVYTLSSEQKETFNHAMQDLSRFYGSFRLA